MNIRPIQVEASIDNRLHKITEHIQKLGYALFHFSTRFFYSDFWSTSLQYNHPKLVHGFQLIPFQTAFSLDKTMDHNYFQKFYYLSCILFPIPKTLLCNGRDKFLSEVWIICSKNDTS